MGGPSRRSGAMLALVGAISCSRAQPTGEPQASAPAPAPAPSSFPSSRAPSVPDAEPLPRIAPFDGEAHCASLRRIAVGMGLLEGPREDLTTRSTTDVGDAHESRSVGLILPSGFDACALRHTRRVSLNTAHLYACSSRLLSTLPPDIFEKMQATWRTCLAPPEWTPARDVKYRGGLRSAHAGNPDAYVRAASSGPDPGGLFTERFCALEKNAERIEMTCGTRTNN